MGTAINNVGIPSNQTLLSEAAQLACYTNYNQSSQNAALASYLSAYVNGTPLNPDLTKQQIADYANQIACMADGEVRNIIVNQFARILWLIQPSTPNYLYDDVADLRTLSYDSVLLKRSYQINGLDTPWDGQGGFYAWDPTYVGPDDGFTYIILNDTAGRPGAMRKL